MIGRAIVLVREDQLSLAIGKRGQNVRLASQLTGWELNVMDEAQASEKIVDHLIEMARELKPSHDSARIKD